MRVLLCLLLLAGCADPGETTPATTSDGTDGTDGTSGADGTNGTDGNGTTPTQVDVLNTTLNLAPPGGSATARFTVPEGDYLELFVRTTGDVTLLGSGSVVFVGPDGRHTLFDAMFAQDDGRGIALQTCGSCEWRVPSAPGAWSVESEMEGQMVLPVRVTAQ